MVSGHQKVVRDYRKANSLQEQARNVPALKSLLQEIEAIVEEFRDVLLQRFGVMIELLSICMIAHEREKIKNEGKFW